MASIDAGSMPAPLRPIRLDSAAVEEAPPAPVFDQDASLEAAAAARRRRHLMNAIVLQDLLLKTC